MLWCSLRISFVFSSYSLRILRWYAPRRYGRSSEPLHGADRLGWAVVQRDPRSAVQFGQDPRMAVITLVACAADVRISFSVKKLSRVVDLHGPPAFSGGQQVL